MSTKWRWILWLSILAVTIVAAIYPTTPESKNTTKRTHVSLSNQAITTGTTTASTAATDILPTHLPELSHDPFDPVSWDTPPPPPPAPPVVVAPVAVEPPAPVEPPLPYQYQGQMKNEDGTTVIFLSRGQEAITAHVGDQLDANYKLVALDENKLTILYLPMDHLHDIALEAH
jgi:hypothetical protein